MEVDLEVAALAAVAGSEVDSELRGPILRVVSTLRVTAEPS